jgi:hypothetical protein
VIVGLEDDIIPAVADIDGAIQDLQAKIKAFQSETFDQLPDVPQAQAFLITWNAFVADFDQWRGAFWVDRWKRRNEVLAYRKRFNGLQEFWRGLVGTVATTTPQYKAAEITGPSYGIPSWVVPAALVLGGLVLVSQLGVLGPAMGSLKSLVSTRANPRRRRRR